VLVVTKGGIWTRIVGSDEQGKFEPKFECPRLRDAMASWACSFWRAGAKTEIGFRFKVAASNRLWVIHWALAGWLSYTRPAFSGRPPLTPR
jgi:hypothetical protein